LRAEHGNPDFAKLITYRLMPLAAMASLFVLIQKVTKKIKATREASLPHRAFALQNVQNPGGKSLRLVRSIPPLQQKFPMPCNRTNPASFCPFSIEAYPGCR